MTWRQKKKSNQFCILNLKCNLIGNCELCALNDRHHRNPYLGTIKRLLWKKSALFKELRIPINFFIVPKSVILITNHSQYFLIKISEKVSKIAFDTLQLWASQNWLKLATQKALSIKNVANFWKRHFQPLKLNNTWKKYHQAEGQF